MSIDARFRDALNFRDLGGLKCEDGRTVKPHLFYRGGGLYYFNEDELKEFEKLGIQTIMDLRSASEIERMPDPEISGARNIAHSGLVVRGSEDIDWSPAGMRKIGGEAKEQLRKIQGYYENIALNNKAFQIMMKEVEEGKLPIYFHCMTGKDRTGVAAIILLLALGVKKEEILKDYLESNVFRKQIVEDSIAKAGGLARNHPELRDLITIQDGVLQKTYETVMASILKKYASYGEYLEEEYGLDEDKLKALRDAYLQ